jgi:signal transduction histidine kinase
MVSQISLLAGNAERHAENPAFRADMVLTLKETADRMNDLISRLARPDQKRGGEGGGCDLTAVARGIAATGLMRGRVVVTADGPLLVCADAESLKQAVSHLVQNAIDATPPDGAPVELILSRTGSEARLEIVDQGCGMSADFIANGLFRPFASTKSAGFGLGAHEAQALITAMSGRIDVASRQGHGTRFAISLPLLQEDAASQTHQDRKIG